MAAQLATLLCDSDLDELREVVSRWVATAPSAATRAQYQRLGAELVELKHALSEMPTPPTRQELEFQLTLMMRLALERT